MKKTFSKNILRFIGSIILIFLPVLTYADSSHTATIKLAILDNFTIEQYPQRYTNDYFAGINTAIAVAQKEGVQIQYKMFAYGSNPLDILNVLPDVNAWQPDFIIGPHFSNQFLLLKKYFTDILVLTPYATDEATQKMPKNFYSLSLPDSYMAKANLTFISMYYPAHPIFNISQADCKDCVDLTNIFNNLYKNKYPNAVINNAFYVGDQIEDLDYVKLMKNYKKDSIIILQPLSYADANIMTARIASVLKNQNLVFLYNLDNWGNSKEVSQTETDVNNNYKCFRVSPLFIDTNSKRYKSFISTYENLYHTSSFNSVTYMTYVTVLSVVDALHPTKVYNKSNLKEVILNSYLTALIKDPNWYRPESFLISTMSDQGEQKIGVIPR